jgi:hypothetical protein
MLISSSSSESLPGSHFTNPPQVRPDSPAFIMYTSGSTGTPKGVIQEHSGICGSVMTQAVAIGITGESRTLQFAAYTFDVSMGDIFGSFSQGACVCVVSDEDRLNNLASDGIMAISLRKKGAYVAQLTYRLPPTIDAAKLKVAWGILVSQNDILRTRIVQTVSGPMQAVIKSGVQRSTINVEDTVISVYLEKDKDNRMEYGQPLTRFALIKSTDQTPNYLVWTIHQPYTMVTACHCFSRIWKGSIWPKNKCRPSDSVDS